MYLTGSGEKVLYKFGEDSSGQPNGLFIGYEGKYVFMQKRGRLNKP